MRVDPLEQFFKGFEDALNMIFDSMREFALNYVFGLLALLFGIRVVSGLIQGRFSVIACILTVIFGFLAFSMGQAFWSDFPVVRMLFQ